MINIGFIGLGNMGSALLSGILNHNFTEKNNLYGFDADSSRMTFLLEKNRCSDVVTVLKKCDVIIMTIKPNLYEKILKSFQTENTRNKIIVSVAPGITISKMEQWLGKEAKIVRTMPNTPALTGEGMTVFVPNTNISEKDLGLVESMLDCVGKTQQVTENLMDIAVGVSGSAPAYVYMLIDAIADGGVAEGMNKEMAVFLAAQTVLGSAKMVLETKASPSVLKDMVCSPGGTTIEAVAQLEKHGFRSAIISAVRKCKEKASAMSK